MDKSVIINSVIFYGTIIGTTTLLTYLWNLQIKKHRKILSSVFALLVVLFPSIIAAMRYGIGTDYQLYVYIFNAIKNNVSLGIEPGYTMINYLVSIFGGDIHAVFFICSFIGMTFVLMTLYFAKDKISVTFGMFIYMMWFYQLSFNAVRQSLAMAIILFSLKYIDEKKFVKFFLLIILAASFHISAIVMLPFYFIYHITNGKNRFVISLLVYSLSIILLFNFNTILNILVSNVGIFSRYSQYISVGSAGKKIGYGVLIPKLIFIIPALFLYKKLTRYDKLNHLLIMLLLLDLIFGLLVYLENWVSRIEYYFFISQVLMIPQISNQFKKSKIVMNLFYVCWIIFYWILIYFINGDNQTVPYESIIRGGY